MNHKSHIEMLREFHLITGNNWEPIPTIPSENRLKLRANLVLEEAREFSEASEARDLVGMVDGLIDTIYVSLGSLGELGMGNIVDKLFAEVHRSNMSKVCYTIQTAIETINWYKERDDENRCEADYKEVNGNYLVFRISDNKTLKSFYYSPADLHGVIVKELNSLGIDPANRPSLKL
jgi:predicted HAD superfamily Cof-like phosphohydrolase